MRHALAVSAVFRHAGHVHNLLSCSRHLMPLQFAPHLTRPIHGSPTVVKEALSLQSPENLFEKHRSQSQLALMSIHRAHEKLDAPQKARLQGSKVRLSKHITASISTAWAASSCAMPATTSVTFSSSRSCRAGSAELSRHALSHFLGSFCTVEGVGSAHRPQCNRSFCLIVVVRKSGQSE